MSYSVGELAKLARVSIRTLHHYDEIGLLSPGRRTQTGHRRYDDAHLHRLRRILGYRELGFDLASIKRMLDDSAVDPGLQLRLQHSELIAQISRLKRTLRRVTLMVEERHGGEVQPAENADIEELWRALGDIVSGVVDGAFDPDSLKDFGSQFQKRFQQSAIPSNMLGTVLEQLGEAARALEETPPDHRRARLAMGKAVVAVKPRGDRYPESADHRGT